MSIIFSSANYPSVLSLWASSVYYPFVLSKYYQLWQIWFFRLTEKCDGETMQIPTSVTPEQCLDDAL